MDKIALAGATSFSISLVISTHRSVMTGLWQQSEQVAHVDLQDEHWRTCRHAGLLYQAFQDSDPGRYQFMCATLRDLSQELGL
ncbi:hypothetical protein ACFO1V_11880 [Daeguia caeni]|uniref:Uncharacterized protein n=1 Tax=Daeguia caeni TaxID=439612 RepID=A0ABV9H7R8_9HYPH